MAEAAEADGVDSAAWGLPVQELLPERAVMQVGEVLRGSLVIKAVEILDYILPPPALLRLTPQTPYA